MRLLCYAFPDFSCNQARFAHLALLGVDLLVVQPSFSPYIAVSDVSQLRGGVTFRPNLLRCPDVVQRLKHNRKSFQVIC